LALRAHFHEKCGLTGDFESLRPGFDLYIPRNKSGDVTPQMACEDGRKKVFYLRGITLDLQLDATVNKILYPSDHFISGSDASDRVAKTDTLNPAFVADAFCNHGLSLPEFLRVPADS